MQFQAEKDYAESGLTIQYALLDQVKSLPNKEVRPKYILWGGRHVTTADVLPVPENGVVRAEIISSKEDVEQGFDLKVDGWIEMAQGERVTLLRTWSDPQYEPVVEYPFLARDGRLHVWNVYKMKYGSGQVVEEKWTENAGMWIEEVSPTERVYHCSHGKAHPPDFDSLVFRVSVRPSAK